MGLDNTKESFKLSSLINKCCGSDEHHQVIKVFKLKAALDYQILKYSWKICL